MIPGFSARVQAVHFQPVDLERARLLISAGRLRATATAIDCKQLLIDHLWSARFSPD